MLARCAKCQSKFVTERFGRQRCPVCDAEVEIADPSASPSVPADGTGKRENTLDPARPTSPPAGSLTPWEQREALGAWPAFKATVGELVSDPSGFFSRIAPETGDHGGRSLSWLMLVVIPQAIAGALGVATTDWAKSYADMQELSAKTGLPFDPTGAAKSIYAWMDRPEVPLLTALVSLVAAPVLLYVLASLSHLGLRMTGATTRPFDATLRAYAYTFTPGLLGVLPACGGLAGFAWTVLLQYVAIHKTHGTDAGRTVLGGFVLPVLLLTCVISPVLTLVSVALLRG